MKISVRVKPNARKSEVKDLGERKYVVSVTAPPVDGKANDLVVELLAEYFDKPKRAITIIRGANAREKIVEVS